MKSENNRCYNNRMSNGMTPFPYFLLSFIFPYSGAGSCSLSFPLITPLYLTIVFHGEIIIMFFVGIGRKQTPEQNLLMESYKENTPEFEQLEECIEFSDKERSLIF